MKIYYIHQEDNLELDNDERLNRIDDVFQSERELVLAGITDEQQAGTSQAVIDWTRTKNQIVISFQIYYWVNDSIGRKINTHHDM